MIVRTEEMMIQPMIVGTVNGLFRNQNILFYNQNVLFLNQGLFHNQNILFLLEHLELLVEDLDQQILEMLEFYTR
jgi:hypothetical protein